MKDPRRCPRVEVILIATVHIQCEAFVASRHQERVEFLIERRVGKRKGLCPSVHCFEPTERGTLDSGMCPMTLEPSNQ